MNAAIPSSESRYELLNDVTVSYDVVFKTFDIPSHPDGYDFEDTVSICLSTHRQDQSVGKSSLLQDAVNPYFTCKINGLLVDDEIYAKQYVEFIVNKVCRELSLVLIRYNSNRHLYQPRVEPNWNKTVWNYEEYQPYNQARQNALKNIDSNKHVNRLDDHFHIKETVYRMSTISIPEREIDIKYWLEEADDNLEFLINEYYSALGSEKIKSKFFHLFAMIEFIEQKYADYNGANPVLSNDEIDHILDALDNKISSEKKKDVLSGIKNSLLKMNDTGRVQKLLNILNWMKIEKYKRFGKDSLIDKKMLKEIIEIRNKSFHGTLENKDAAAKYIDAVEKLFYINEQIIEFVRQLKHQTVMCQKILITGQKR